MEITFSNALKDKIVLICFISITLLSIFISIIFGKIYGLFIFLSFGFGNLFSIIIIAQRDQIAQFKNAYFNNKKKIQKPANHCEVCQEKYCTRHQEPLKDNSNLLLINYNLDKSIESFYSKIISSFIQSWFSLLSHDENFVHTLKKSLREVTAHLVLKIRKLNGADFITQKICPLIFKHIDNVRMILIDDGISNDKLPNEFLKRNFPIHPACANRKAEKDYLRAVAKCLIPKIFHSENFDSKIFFSLIRELLACWVFLPLLDVMSDPNLLNLMAVQMLNKSQNDKFSKFKEFNQKVEFLQKFIHNSNLEKDIECDSTILTDEKKLYEYMQFLKRNGMVDILRFYLDVESLNKESSIAIDPAQISALQRESEKLLLDYNKLMKNEKFSYLTPEKALAKAQDNIRYLEGKLRREFTQTSDYFKLVYGSKEIEFQEDNKNLDQNTVAKIRSKIKGALKTLDGEIATEIPTVWDAFALEPHSNLSSANTTIYNSVTQKLRRERGQNLDAFLLTFIQSLEQNTDVGVEVVDVEKDKRRKQKNYAIESSLIFGDLFGLSKFSKKNHRSFYISFDVIGASRSVLYIVHKLLTVKAFLVKFIYSLICLWQETVDNLICNIINKLISMGLYQPRLAILISLLEEHLFEEKHSETTYTELMERKNNAKKLLISYNSGFGDILEILQSPVLNKHLMYCIFDAVLSELYTEFKN